MKSKHLRAGEKELAKKVGAQSPATTPRSIARRLKKKGKL